MTRIGGHRGLDVNRIAGPGHQTGATIIEKVALHEKGNQGDLIGVDLYDLNETAIHNEAMMLDIMMNSGFTPKLIDIDHGVLLESDVGTNEPATDPELWRQNLVKMLATIRSRGLRHGDLKGSNIVTRNNWPWAIDWQEGHHLGDIPPQKNPFTDSYLLMQHIEGTPDAKDQIDVPRVGRRWRTVLGALGAIANLNLPLKGKTFLDLGCFQGDFVALAAAEGMRAHGIDSGGFRSGENSIQIGKALWKDFPFGEVSLHQADIIHFTNFECDVVMMFSTLPYIVQQHGWPVADALLERIIRGAGVFFFETQLAGDGPGLDLLKHDDDVYDMLKSVGAQTVIPLGTIPVTNRPASRTVWKVEG